MIFGIICYIIIVVLFVFVARSIDKEDVEHDYNGAAKEGLLPLWQVILLGMFLFWTLPALVMSSRPWHHPGGY